MKTITKTHEELKPLINKILSKLENISYWNILELIYPNIKWDYEESGDIMGEWFAVGKGDHSTYYFSQGEYGSCAYCDQIEGFRYDLRQLGVKDKKLQQEFCDFLVEMSRIECVEGKTEFINYLKIKKETLFDRQFFNKYIYQLEDENEKEKSIKED